MNVFMQDMHHIEPRELSYDFIRNVGPNFISAEERAPNLNPLDYSVCDIMQDVVYEGRCQPYTNLHEVCDFQHFDM